MLLNIGDVFPDFSAKTATGDISFHNWLGKSWCMFFSVTHPFSRGCTEELTEIVELVSELKKRNIKPLGLVCCNVQTQLEWISNIRNTTKGRINQIPFPIIADHDRRLSILLSLLDLEQQDSDRIPLAGRGVFFIDPESKLRLYIKYPTSARLNLLEIFRVMESIQKADRIKDEAQQETQMNPEPTSLPGISTGQNIMSFLPKTLPNFDFLDKMPPHKI